MSGERSVQYRVVRGKHDESVGGSAEAGLVVSVPIAVLEESGFDPTVEFMRGRLKVVGHTGTLFDVLRSGEAARELSELASPS